MTHDKAVHARITGRVQGVSFRAWTQIEAQLRDLCGWVRNEADGSVTTVLAGASEAVDDMARALHRGPPAAVVNGVEISATDWPDATRFDIRR
ncbi:acylphosphatase [Roseovarius amoyensis]|uniref:acylphosphatase n=1 Tax=Roseovarius amoyensis TaxID=2211448 RepID=UPI000DBE6BB3|nr:acylphosphatase [Roseovarius amoyensis]